MSGDVNIDGWVEFYRGNTTVPPHPSRHSTGDEGTHPFCLTLNTVQVNYANSEPCKFSARLTFYDAANRWFFGSTWSSAEPVRSKVASGTHTIDFNEKLYFQTTLNDYTCIAVIEVVCETEEGRSVSVGWSWVRLFVNHTHLTDTEDTALPQQEHLQFYHGSPAALLFLNEPLEECVHLQKSSGHLTYTLQTHEELRMVSHLLPSNVVVNGDDIIPGVSEETSQDGNEIDILINPQLMKTWPCQLQKVRLRLPPSVEQFEEQLCSMVNNDRLSRDNVEQDCAMVTVVERRLQVGVHNGWRFVKTPHILYVGKEVYNKRPNSRLSSSPAPAHQKNQQTEGTCLVLSSRLELDEMINHPLVAIVFQLIYVLQIPLSLPKEPDKKTKLGASYGSMPLTKKVEVAVRNALWVPFENGKISNKPCTLNLSGGITDNPFDTPLFTETLTASTQQSDDSGGTIDFNFVQTRIKKSTNRSMRDSPALSSPMPNQQNLLPLSQHLQPTSQLLQQQQQQLLMQQQQQLLQQSYQQQATLLPTQQQQQEFVRTEQMNDSIPCNPVEQVQQLNALPHSQMYTQLVVAPPSVARTSHFSRMFQSLLHTVDFPKITDTRGDPPFMIDPRESMRYDISLETRDALHANQITLQFMAVSMCEQKCVFFTFQFYRFPQTTTERLHLKHVDEGVSDRILRDRTLPCVLRPSARDGSVSTNAPPGLTIKYTVDPAFLQLNEQQSFLKYLHLQRLHIDMWDGDSLLHIGSTAVELKYLLRQGKPAVQTSHELDILATQCEDTTQAGDVFRVATTTDVVTNVAAKLFLRTVNVGCLPETNVEKLQQTKTGDGGVVISSDTSTPTLPPSSAKLMSECDAELASVLVTRKDVVTNASTEMKIKDTSAVRQRKLERMQAVRQLRGGDELSSAFVLQKEEKIQRTRDLRTIQFYRDNLKAQGIASKLEESITTRHVVHSSLGRAEFFEFSLRNPYHEDQVVYIHTDDPELSVVVNCREWRFHKKQNGMSGDVEEQMFTPPSSEGKLHQEEGVKMFLRGVEKVNVPFKFQSMTAHNITPETGPSHPLNVSSNYTLQTFGKDTTLSSKAIKVSFFGLERKLLAILEVRVEIHPHTIDQTFRFYHPEQTFLKKSIRMPPLHNHGSSREPANLVAVCSDDSAICETHQISVGEPHEVFLKVPCGFSPNVRRFFVLVFNHDYNLSPCQIWQIYVHSLQRVDVSVTEGQASKFSMLLKGTQSSRMVRCFTSHPVELKVTPREPFMLRASGVQEIGLTLNPMATGTRMMFVNVVDQDFHQLVKSWLIMASCRPPVVSKTFDVHLKVGVGSNKKISFTNPYPVKKNFFFQSNREDLLKIVENGIMLGGGESHNIGLTFLPQSTQGSSAVFIFINDKDGNNEECFSVNVNYAR